MRELGYGKNYAYDHDAPDTFSGQSYWPEEMSPQVYYRPSDRGFEKRLAERLAWWNDMRKDRQGGS
jgi:putative ATPase